MSHSEISIWVSQISISHLSCLNLHQPVWLNLLVLSREWMGMGEWDDY